MHTPRGAYDMYGGPKNQDSKLADMRFKASFASSQRLDYGFSELLSSFCPDKDILLRDAVLADDVNAFRSEVLKARRVDPYFPDRMMSYWFNFSCAAGSVSIVQDVLQSRTFVPLGNTPLCYAASSGNANLCNMLMSYPDVTLDSEVVDFSHLSENIELQMALGQKLANLPPLHDGNIPET